MARTAAAVAASKPKSGNAAALKRRQQGAEHVQVLENNPSVMAEDAMVDPADLSSDPFSFKPPAVNLRTVDEEAKRGPKVKRFRAMNDKRVQTQRNGGRTMIVVGKELDELNYDIKLMREQGLKLEEITDAAPKLEDEFDDED